MATVLEGGVMWISVKEKLPEHDTPVLAVVEGIDNPIVLELRQEICNPYVDGYFANFSYWDNPDNDGQDYEDRVVCWMELPPMPTKADLAKPPHEPDFGCNCKQCDAYWDALKEPIPEGDTEEYDDEHEKDQAKFYELKT